MNSMNSIRNGLLASSVLLLGSLALAVNTSRVVQVAGGNASIAAQPQEELLASVNPSAAQQASAVASEQQLKMALEKLGLVVD